MSVRSPPLLCVTGEDGVALGRGCGATGRDRSIAGASEDAAIGGGGAGATGADDVGAFACGAAVTGGGVGSAGASGTTRRRRRTEPSAVDAGSAVASGAGA